MRRFLLIALIWSCVDAPTTPEPDRPAVADAVAAGTALLAVSLQPDGSLDIDAIAPRPIPFRQRGPRFDPTRHGARPQPPPTGAGVPVPGNVDDRGPLGPDLAPPPAPPTKGPCAIIVRHGAASPVVVPLDLGHPGEGSGDVLDRWQFGSVILRAPYFGPGSHYTVIRMAPAGSVALAEKEVTP